MTGQYHLAAIPDDRQQKKRRPFAILAVILLATMLLPDRAANGAISYVQKVGGYAQGHSYNTLSITIPVTATVTAGNSIIVSIAWDYADVSEIFTCSDDAGNSYSTDVSSYSSGAGAHSVICSAHNVNALGTSNNITITVTDPGGASKHTTGAAVSIHEFSGLLPASPLDQASGNSGGSGTPAAVSSGDTATTTQASELLVGAIGADNDSTPVFSTGSGYILLESISHNGTLPGNLNVEYKTVSATGVYRADGSLSDVDYGWSAVIATYKAAPDITLSGTLYSDEGSTPVVSADQTVRLLIDGISAGTDVTDSSGNYSITTTVTAGDTYIPLLVYVDDGSVVGTTVTVMDPVNVSNTVSDLHIYADHLITRQDEGGTPLDNGDISNADGNYSDTDILYYVLGSDLTVRGANTELYIPSLHSYSPGGNITTAHMQIEGTLTAGSNTFTVSGNWEHANGTFNYDTSTVDFTGTGTISAGDIWWTKPFYNVSAAAAGETTTILAGKGIDVANVLTLGSETLAGGNVNLSLDSGTPLVTAGAAITNSQIKFHPNSGGPINVAGTAYTNIWLAGNAATNTFNLSGNMSCTVLNVYGSGPGDSAVFDTGAGNYSVACNEFVIGSSSNPDRYGTLKLNSSTLNITGNIAINSSDLSGTNQIDAGSATINVSGDWSNSDTFTPGTSSVILDGIGQQLQGDTTFYNLTKTVTSADTLTFTAGTTQTITGTATLQGANGQLLSLRSSASPTRWNFNLASGASKAISYVDVQDSDASGSDSSLIEINPSYSTNSGNNVSWFGSANITVAKSSAVISDPVNGTTNPKRIPGAVVEYTILVTNTAGAQATSVTISDDLSTESARLSFKTDGYASGKGIQVTAPNINGGAALDLTNAADSDAGEYSSSTVTVSGIILSAGEQATVKFQVTIQ